jgi:hypothetical protein
MADVVGKLRSIGMLLNPIIANTPIEEVLPSCRVHTYKYLHRYALIDFPNTNPKCCRYHMSKYIANIDNRTFNANLCGPWYCKVRCPAVEWCATLYDLPKRVRDGCSYIMVDRDNLRLNWVLETHPWCMINIESNMTITRCYDGHIICDIRYYKQCSTCSIVEAVEVSLPENNPETMSCEYERLYHCLQKMNPDLNLGSTLFPTEFLELALCNSELPTELAHLIVHHVWIRIVLDELSPQIVANVVNMAKRYCW